MMFRTVYLFFRYFLGKPVPETPEFDADRAIADHALLEARERARHGDWQAARKVIEDAGNDWELRGRRVAELSSLAQKEDGWLYAWLRPAPSDPSAVHMQAVMLGGRAAVARGSKTAEHTSAEQFVDFEQLSEAAAQVGRRAMELAPPGDPLPWVTFMQAFFSDRHGRGITLDEVFDEGRRRDPYNFDLHFRAVTLRCQKWGGSHEQMFSTAREVAAAAPPGANSVMFPLFAHIEYVLLEIAWDKKLEPSVRGAKRYFRRAEVRQELDQWIAKWRAGTPNPANRSTVLQWVAMFYILAGRRKAAREVFDELGQYVSPVAAWAYIWGDREYGYLSSWLWANRI
ncbi:hypothetical protein [Actinoplanes sp. GCM10030250]|uniref:hypothetical protein n=1 Tax=Actinoplanes sp. GCM10030250 TaxID=3273376 RepID=UPI003610DE66